MSRLDEVAADAQKYEIEEALRTITKAEEYKKDPKLMAQVTRMAEEKKGIYKSIASLKRKYNALEKSDRTPDMPVENNVEQNKDSLGTKPMPIEPGILPSTLEENRYIDRAKAAQDIADKPQVALVQIVDDEDDGDEE